MTIKYFSRFEQLSSTIIQSKHEKQVQKLRKTHLKSKRNGRAVDFQQRRNLKKMKMVREKRNENERRDVQKSYLNFPLLIGLYKEKVKSKIFLTLGKITQMSSTFPNPPNQSHSLLICSIQSFFPQIRFTNNSIVQLHIYPYRVSRN